jgi:hypothetical protein
MCRITTIHKNDGSYEKKNDVSYDKTALSLLSFIITSVLPYVVN